MKLTLQIQLLPDKSAAARLIETVERFNEACNWLAGVAFAARCSRTFDLHKIAYRELRDRFGLPADMACRCLARVCDAYCRDKAIQPTFRPHASVPYSVGKNIGFKGPDRVSLSTLAGRVVVSFLTGKYQADRFTRRKGQSDLILRADGKWFLLVTVEVPEATPIPVTDFIGIDLGTVNIATDSDGGQMSGEKVEKARRKYGDKRRSLQKAATKRKQSGKRPRSIRRKLRKDQNKESRYKRDVNHCTTKAYVETAERTERGIALEDLTGIGQRITARSGDARDKLSGWSFGQFRFFLEYKAKLAGVPVVIVDPAYTSQTCPECGYCDARNRKTQATFSCLYCGHSDDADRNGARNIRARALVKVTQSGPIPVDILRWMPIEPPKCRNVGRSRKRYHRLVQAQAARVS
jgi:IS605 OrfB family transposase